MAEYHEFIVDPRSRGDLVAEMGRLAASYTPEWKFDPEDPDIGAVIGLIFADQMSDTVGALNQVMDKYRTEFVNMLGISLLPATPAGGVAVVNLVPDTVPGVQLPKGSRLQGQAGEDGGLSLLEGLDPLLQKGTVLGAPAGGPGVRPGGGQSFPLLPTGQQLPRVRLLRRRFPGRGGGCCRRFFLGGGGRTRLLGNLPGGGGAFPVPLSGGSRLRPGAARQHQDSQGRRQKRSFSPVACHHFHSSSANRFCHPSP